MGEELEIGFAAGGNDRDRDRIPGTLAARLLLSWDNDAREVAALGAFVGDEPLLVHRRHNARDLTHFGVALRTGRRMGERGT